MIDFYLNSLTLSCNVSLGFDVTLQCGKEDKTYDTILSVTYINVGSVDVLILALRKVDRL